jgi:hypothetical protein
MNKSTIEAGQPEQQPTNEPTAESIPSAQVSANALVGRRRLVEEEKMRELISSIKINDANIDYIRNHPERKINGSLFLDIKRILNEYAEFKNKVELQETDIYYSIYMEVVELVEKHNIQCEFYSETAKKLKENYCIIRR